MSDGAGLEAFERRLGPLWRLAQSGDETAYREALACVAQRLRGYLRRRCASHPDDLEDLVQDSLLAIHLQRGTHEADQPVSAWVLAIARHKLIDLWRRRGRREALHETWDDLDEALPAEETQAAGTQRDLLGLLDSLPAAQRQAIWWTKVEGLSVAEAAQRSGASVAALKVQVHRGLKRLAERVRSGD